MLKRQLVLVAIDHATDVERTMEAALSTAKARGADVHAIQVVPHRAMHVDDRTDLWPFEPHDDRSVAIGARLASMPRSADHDGVRVRRVTLRGEPAHVIPGTPSSTRPQTGRRARLWQLTVLAKRPSGGRDGAPVADTAARIAKATYD